MSAEKTTVPPVTSVPSVETKSDEPITDNNTASGGSSKAVPATIKPPVKLDTLKSPTTSVASANDSKIIPPVTPKSGDIENKQGKQVDISVSSKKKDTSDTTNNSKTSLQNAAVTTKQPDTAVKISSDGQNQPSSKEIPVTTNVEKEKLKDAITPQKLPQEIKVMKNDSNASHQSDSTAVSPMKESITTKTVPKNDNGMKTLTPPSNANQHITASQKEDASIAKGVTEPILNPAKPSVNITTKDTKALGNDKTSNDQLTLGSKDANIEQKSGSVSKPFIDDSKMEKKKGSDDKNSKPQASIVSQATLNSSTLDENSEKTILKSALTQKEEKKMLPSEKNIDHKLEKPFKPTNSIEKTPSKTGDLNKKENSTGQISVKTSNKETADQIFKQKAHADIANPNKGTSTNVKSGAVTSEKASANIEKPSQVAGSNLSDSKQVPLIEKSESLLAPSSINSQSSIKQTFPVTQSSPAPPITQPLQATVPPSTKQLDPKANGGSQASSKELTPSVSSVAASTNQSMLYPSSDTHRKSNSPSSAKSIVGPPKPTTANVAPVIPPRPCKPVQSEPSVPTSNYNQKPSHDAQSTRNNPITAASHGAYQWPMHAMAAAASSAGSASAYGNTAGSYNSGNMSGAYGSGGTFGGSTDTTAHAQNPFMNPLMTQMRQSNPQAAAMLAFAAAASHAQQMAQQRQQQQQQQLQHHQQHLHHQQQQHYPQQHHHQQQAHHQQSHHQQHTHHQQTQQHQSQQHTQQQPPPAHHSHQQQRHQPWPSAAYGSPAHPSPASNNKTNQQVAHASTHHSMSGLTKPPTSNSMPKHVPTSSLTALKPPQPHSSSNAISSKHSQSTTSSTVPKQNLNSAGPAGSTSKSHSLGAQKDTGLPYGHVKPTNTSKVLPFPKQPHGGSSINAASSKSNTPVGVNNKIDKRPEPSFTQGSRLETPSKCNTKSSSPTSASKLPSPPAMQPIKAFLPPKPTENAIKPTPNKDIQKQETLSKNNKEAKVDVKSSSIVQREGLNISSNAKKETSTEKKNEGKQQGDEGKNRNDRKLDKKVEDRRPQSESANLKALSKMPSLDDHKKVVPPLKLNKKIAEATSPPLRAEEKVPPLKISKLPASSKREPDNRTVAPLKLGKLPQMKSPKPAEKKPRKRPLSKVHAPPPPV